VIRYSRYHLLKFFPLPWWDKRRWGGRYFHTHVVLQRSMKVYPENKWVSKKWWNKKVKGTPPWIPPQWGKKLNNSPPVEGCRFRGGEGAFYPSSWALTFRGREDLIFSLFKKVWNEIATSQRALLAMTDWDRIFILTGATKVAWGSILKNYGDDKSSHYKRY
jgi:hypothetical protein